MNLRGDAPIHAHSSENFCPTTAEAKSFGKIVDLL